MSVPPPPSTLRASRATSYRIRLALACSDGDLVGGGGGLTKKSPGVFTFIPCPLASELTRAETGTQPSEVTDGCRATARAVRTRTKRAGRASGDRPGDVARHQLPQQEGRHHRPDPACRGGSRYPREVPTVVPPRPLGREPQAEVPPRTETPRTTSSMPMRATAPGPDTRAPTAVRCPTPQAPCRPPSRLPRPPPRSTPHLRLPPRSLRTTPPPAINRRQPPMRGYRRRRGPRRGLARVEGRTRTASTSSKVAAPTSRGIAGDGAGGVVSAAPPVAAASASSREAVKRPSTRASHPGPRPAGPARRGVRIPPCRGVPTKLEGRLHLHQPSAPIRVASG